MEFDPEIVNSKYAEWRGSARVGINVNNNNRKYNEISNLFSKGNPNLDFGTTITFDDLEIDREWINDGVNQIKVIVQGTTGTWNYPSQNSQPVIRAEVVMNKGASFALIEYY